MTWTYKIGISILPCSGPQYYQKFLLKTNGKKKASWNYLLLKKERICLLKSTSKKEMRKGKRLKYQIAGISSIIHPKWNYSTYNKQDSRLLQFQSRSGKLTPYWSHTWLHVLEFLLVGGYMRTGHQIFMLSSIPW